MRGVRESPGHLSRESAVRRGYGGNAERRILVGKVFDLADIRRRADDKVRRIGADVAGRVGYGSYKFVCARCFKLKRIGHGGKHRFAARAHGELRGEPGIDIVGYFDRREGNVFSDDIYPLHFAQRNAGRVAVYNF